MADSKGKSKEVNLDINKSIETDSIDTKSVVSSKSNEVSESNSAAEVTEQAETAEPFKITSAYIDRIEEVEDGESEAVLYIDDDESEDLPKIVLPVSLLPDEIYEGDYVLIKISYDKDKSE